MNETGQDVPNNDTASTSRRYRTALTVAMLLFLVVLTISIAVIIISRDEDEREAAFDATLTAVYAQFQQTNAATVPLTRTPQNVPPPVHEVYAFALAAESPGYAAAEPCSVQTISGAIRDQEGSVTDAYNVYMWGDFLPAQYILTGELAGHDAGHWSVTLDPARNRRVFVQLTAADRYLSAPVELAFDAQDCARNHATIAFEQIAPLD